jgi:hypothetical protein
MIFLATGTRFKLKRSERTMMQPFPRVTIEPAQLGKPRNISSVTEAAEFLFMNWPHPDGAKLCIARQICFDALDGKASVAEARSAFIEAAKEAGIFLDYMRKIPEIPETLNYYALRDGPSIT